MAQPRGPEIEATRIRQGMTRTELAKRVDRAYNTIYGIERGGQPSAVETLYRIAAALSVDIDTVMARINRGAA